MKHLRTFVLSKKNDLFTYIIADTQSSQTLQTTGMRNDMAQKFSRLPDWQYFDSNQKCFG
jgi:hypothetical protein